MKCQFYIVSEPLWAWVCTVSDPQDSIKELLNCVLRVLGKKTATRCGPPNCLTRAIRLYEQEPGELFDSSRLGVYVRRWVGCGKVKLPANILPFAVYNATSSPC